MDASKPKDAARYACSAPASPGRVRVLAQMVDEALTSILGRKPEDHEFTLVVSNLDLKARLKAYTPKAYAAGRILEEVVRDPTRALRDVPPARRTALAKAVRVGLEGIDAPDLVVESGNKRQRTTVDDVLLRALKGLEQSPPLTTWMTGQTQTLSPILAITRHVDDPARVYAKVRIEGILAEIPLAPAAVDLAIDAFKEGTPAHVDVQATWESSDGETFSIIASKSRITDVVQVGPVLPPAEWLRQFSELVGPDAAEDAARLAYEERGMDWEALH